MDRKEKKIEGLRGEMLDKQTFDKLFNHIDTYSELPAMLERVAFDVARSEFDSLKEHSICYHIAGMTEIIYGAIRSLKHLENEVKILGINLEEEMDYRDLEKYLALKTILSKLS